MLTVWGEGRGFRVVWMLEEMGLPYRLRQVDLLAGVENDPEFLSINPAGFIPALQDGDTILVESIAILQYLAARHGPTPLAPAPDDPAYPAYLQFLMLGEAGLMGSTYWIGNALNLPTEAERNSPTVRHTRWQFANRLSLVLAQLDRAPFMAGDRFTAADISVAYALEHARDAARIPPGPAEAAYLARVTARPGYLRAMAACPARRAWMDGLSPP